MAPTRCATPSSPGMSVGTDVILDPDDLEASFAPGRNFANKLWNAGRFILSNLDGPTRPLAGTSPNAVRPGRAHARRSLDHRPLRCDRARGDRRLRALPPERGRGGGLPLHLERPGRLVHRADQASALRRSCPAATSLGRWRSQTFDVALRLLHPVMPFITEALWRRFPGRRGRRLDLGGALAPAGRAGRSIPMRSRDFGLVQELVGAIRAIRAEYGVQPGQAVRAVVEPERTRQHRGAASEERADHHPARQGFGAHVRGDHRARRRPCRAVRRHAVFVPLGDAIDVGRECGRLGAEVDRLDQLVESQEKKLGNEQFVSRAPPTWWSASGEKLATWRSSARCWRGSGSCWGVG